MGAKVLAHHVIAAVTLWAESQDIKEKMHCERYVCLQAFLMLFLPGMVLGSLNTKIFTKNHVTKQHIINCGLASRDFSGFYDFMWLLLLLS